MLDFFLFLFNMKSESCILNLKKKQNYKGYLRIIGYSQKNLFKEEVPKELKIKEKNNSRDPVNQGKAVSSFKAGKIGTSTPFKHIIGRLSHLADFYGF
tara:strand:+ start:1199 stop:1492 length:294 start_codon:yes stop_codon:yes gene_type:complete